MSLLKSKSDKRIRKKDTCPFLDEALEFLFAIVEREIQKKELDFLAPNIHEFYSFSLHIQIRKTRSNRNKPAISSSLFKVLKLSLGLRVSQIKTPKGQFITCLQTIILALLAYSEFLHCLDSEIKTTDLIHTALSWYFSHYFRPRHHETFLKVLKYQIFEKRSYILQTYVPCTPCFSKVAPCLYGIQVYFQSSEFQENILPALFQCL